MKVNGVVVLYNPQSYIFENIKSYIDQVDKLYLVDNSENKNDSLIDELVALSDKSIYINNDGNKGIAHALNVGAKLAIKDNAQWLLTMDQDSKFDINSIEVLTNYLENNNNEKLGILSPFHATKNLEYVKENKIVDELTVMTSGNLLNLKAYKKVGDFNEKYFIDYVDHEYCLRLQKSGYFVKVHKESILFHELGDCKFYELGDCKFYDFFGLKKIDYSNHNHIRRYYITRNRLGVIRKYMTTFPLFCFKNIKYFIFEWIKIILFEKDKLKKQKSILLGMRDFIMNRYGKYNG